LRKQNQNHFSEKHSDTQIENQNPVFKRVSKIFFRKFEKVRKTGKSPNFQGPFILKLCSVLFFFTLFF